MKRKLILLSGLLASIFLFFFARGCDKKRDKATSSMQLPANAVEKIVVNPEKHTLTIVKPSGNETIYLPDRPSSITIDKHGATKIVARQYGTELSPFIGFAMSDQARVALGVSGLYYKRFELGAALFPSVSGQFSIRLGPVVSYNVASNTSLFLGVTNTGSPIGGLSLKF